MNSYSSYPNTPAGFPTGQREHEQHPIQTRPQNSDNRDPFNGFQSDPWSSQNWSEFPQAPGSMTFSSQYPGHHNTLWESPALETNESTSRYNPHSSLTTSKVILGWNNDHGFLQSSFNESDDHHHHQSPSRSFDSISPTNTTSIGDNSEEDPIAEPPYSALIYESLKDAPERKRTLQEIYEWFKVNTHKDKDPTSKGWQNSIRHNLSMNAGFEAIKGESAEKKPVNYWRLTDEAYEKGIQSTTRYRKANHRKGHSSDPTTRERRRSGSKGGKATKHTTKLRNSPQYEQLKEQQYDQKPMLRRPLSPAQPSQMISSPIRSSEKFSHQDQSMPHGLPSGFSSGLPTSNPSYNCDSYNVVGCTTAPPGENSVFYSTDHSVMTINHGGYYGPVYGGFGANPENTVNLRFV